MTINSTSQSAANAIHPRRDNPHRFRLLAFRQIPIDAFPRRYERPVQVLATPAVCRPEIGSSSTSPIESRWAVSAIERNSLPYRRWATAITCFR